MSSDFLSVSTKAPKSFEKERTRNATKDLLKELQELQKLLFAQSKHSVLIILQGLDASGKDGLINKVFTGLNPLGVDVKSFKAPTDEESKHDFLWRIHRHTPAKGEIMIFNRSHYEDVLVPVVEKKIDGETLKKRYDHINDFEKLLEDHHTIVLKFYLHISPKEQIKRLEERKTNPEKFWKHNDGDWETSKKWDKYMDAYSGIFKNNNVPPWTVVPSDQNWYKEYMVASTLVGKLKKLHLKFPKFQK
jgi:PPK2 family polyphosphate:nucleotide phosphotransferase